ncbi:MAG: ATP-binding protein [Deltaproteobacteria bacterium]|nr:ATP-binding protein [Deltaproteobacteria bacterium]
MTSIAKSTQSALSARTLDHDRLLRERLTRLTFARLFAITGVLAVALVAANGAPSGALSGTIALIYAASIAYAAWLSRGRDLARLATIQIAFDVGAWIAVAFVTGGPGSPLGFFVAVPALSAALVLGAREARVTAAASAMSYGLVTLSYVYHWPAWIAHYAPKIEFTRDELAIHLVGHGVAIPLIAALGSSLAERLRAAGGALATLEARHDEILQAIPVGLITIDPQQRIDGINPVAATLLGLDAQALRRKSAHECLPFLTPEQLESDETHGEATIGTEGNKRHLYFRISPMDLRDARKSGRLVVIEDRTDAELARVRAERDERLAGLGRLAAGLAHEIRNPLGAISGCVELVRESTALSAEDYELMGTVLKESQRLNRLVSDMLTLSRPRAAELSRRDLRSAVDSFLRMATSDGSTVLTRPQREPVWALCDGNLIQQVLWNLLRNALQVTTTGGSVEVWAESEVAGPTLHVADRGPGIARDSKERIFEDFYSEKGSQGTGLGLAVVRQIVEAHDGTIEARDREGGGTEFVVTLTPAESQALC